MVKTEGKDALMCKEYSGKTHQGGIKDKNAKPPEVRYACCSGC